MFVRLPAPSSPCQDDPSLTERGRARGVSIREISDRHRSDHVDWANGGIEDGSPANPYNTVREGIEASGNGTTLSIRAGTYTEGANTFDRIGPIAVTGGAVVVR
jgi:hypothetical protein